MIAVTTASLVRLRMDLAHAECTARTALAERWHGTQTPGTGTPCPGEYDELREHTRHWDARRRELQTACGAAGLHAYVPAFGDAVATRACRLCGALEPRT